MGITDKVTEAFKKATTPMVTSLLDMLGDVLVGNNMIECQHFIEKCIPHGIIIRKGARSIADVFKQFKSQARSTSSNTAYNGNCVDCVQLVLPYLNQYESCLKIFESAPSHLFSNTNKIQATLNEITETLKNLQKICENNYKSVSSPAFEKSDIAKQLDKAYIFRDLWLDFWMAVTSTEAWFDEKKDVSLNLEQFDNYINTIKTEMGCDTQSRFHNEFKSKLRKKFDDDRKGKSPVVDLESMTINYKCLDLKPEISPIKSFFNLNKPEEPEVLKSKWQTTLRCKQINDIIKQLKIVVRQNNDVSKLEELNKKKWDNLESRKKYIDKVRESSQYFTENNTDISDAYEMCGYAFGRLENVFTKKTYFGESLNPEANARYAAQPNSKELLSLRVIIEARNSHKEKLIPLCEEVNKLSKSISNSSNDNQLKEILRSLTELKRQLLKTKGKKEILDTAWASTYVPVLNKLNDYLKECSNNYKDLSQIYKLIPAWENLFAKSEKIFYAKVKKAKKAYDKRQKEIISAAKDIARKKRKEEKALKKASKK